MAYVWEEVQYNQFSSHEVCYTIQYKKYRLETFKSKHSSYSVLGQDKTGYYTGKIVGVRSIKLFGKTLEELEQNFIYYVDQSIEGIKPTLVNCKGIAMRIRYLQDKITGTTQDINSHTPTDVVVFEGQELGLVIKQFEDFLAWV